jgi:hypothetical protein
VLAGSDRKRLKFNLTKKKEVSMKLAEAIEEYGPAVAADHEIGVVITVNGSYFNVWGQRGDDEWENTDAFAVGEDDLGKTSFKAIWERGEEILKDIVEPEDDEEYDDDED